jgi:GTP-binding protein
VKSRKFVDSVTVYAKAGSGGHGSASFRREKFVPRGGPDGGDGGRGGHVIFRASHDEDSLIRLYFSPHQRAPGGGDGKGSRSHGRDGRDVIIAVPCGTLICNKETGALLGDVIAHGQELIVARGGKGGRGNWHYRSATHQAPLEHTRGEPGEEFTLQLELKLVSDAGLVGFPNAGKSSLISVLSDAHPKVAPYPFTTLNPIIGTMIFDDFTRVRVADIPGLIKGAHEGAGLGHDFLRHIERSAILIYVLDMAGVDTRLPYEDYASLRNELKLHREDLVRRPSLVVANKMDLPEAEENLKVFKRKTRTRPIRVSALSGEGLAELRQAIHELYRTLHRP